MAKVIIVRVAHFYGLSRRIYFKTSDQKGIWLLSGERITMDLPEGEYFFQAKMDWISSKVMQLKISRDDIVTLKVGVCKWWLMGSIIPPFRALFLEKNPQARKTDPVAGVEN